MLAFTFKMIITDLQRSFRGYWIYLYFLLLGFITVGPFLEGNIMIFLTNLIIVLFSALVPHISKIFYVLPLGSRPLRRYIQLRAIILSSYFILMGCIISLLSLKLTQIKVERGWLMILFYIMLSILINMTNLEVVTGRKINKNKVLIIAFGLSAGLFINAVLLINFKVQLIISILSVIISEVLIIILFRGANLTNYVDRAPVGLYTRAWREQLKKEG